MSSTLYVMDTLIQSLPEDHSDLLGIDWHFLPVVNPDGYEYTWDVDREWRHTRCGGCYLPMGYTRCLDSLV